MGPAPAGSAAGERVRIALNSAALNLPLFLAIDRGYFAREHVELEILRANVPAMMQLPALARGEIDIAPMVLAPGFFNQYAQGFDVKLIASIQSTHAGWNDNSWILVRQDVWDAGTVRKPSDLRGRAFDGLTPGGPPNTLARAVIAAGGLTPADLTFSERLRVADLPAAFRNKAAEVSASFEPAASELQAQRVAHKWISARDVMPWFQETFLAANDSFVRDHPDVVRRFLIAYLRGAGDVARSNGKWTPAILATLEKWSELPRAALLLMPGPAYADPGGTIDTFSIDRQEETYLDQRLISKAVATADIIDLAPLAAARRTPLAGR